MTGNDMPDHDPTEGCGLLRDQVIEADNDVELLSGFADALRALTREHPWAMMSEWTGGLLDELINGVPSAAAQRARAAHQALDSAGRLGSPHVAGEGR